MKHLTKIKTSEFGPNGTITEVEREPSLEEVNQIELVLNKKKKEREDLYQAFQNLKSSK